MGGEIYPISINEEDNVFTLLQKYINLTGKYNGNYSLVFNGKKLDLITKLKQNNIYSGSNILIYAHKDVMGTGGFCFNFTDLSKQIYDEYPVNNNGPDYRNITQGLNICGNCKYEKCYAYNKEVCVPLNGIISFDLIKERENLKCPACRGLIEPKTVAFYLCGYNIKGKSFENSQVKNFEFSGKALNSESVQYYDPIKNGNTLVIELLIQITNYF